MYINENFFYIFFKSFFYFPNSQNMQCNASFNLLQGAQHLPESVVYLWNNERAGLCHRKPSHSGGQGGQTEGRAAETIRRYQVNDIQSKVNITHVQGVREGKLKAELQKRYASIKSTIFKAR